MDWDDRTIGRLLSRREAVRVLAAGGLGLSAWDVVRGQAGTSPAPQCIARPELEEGPYFLEARAVRSDIRSDAGTARPRPGVKELA